MANRSYLYSYHPGTDNTVRDLAEWKTNVPVAHYLLVSSNPAPVKSEIWTVDEKIAIRGDAEPGRDLLFRFLTWLEPQICGSSVDGLGDLFLEGMQEFQDHPDLEQAVPELIRQSKQARELLLRDDRLGSHYHLELGEIYELSGYELHEMEDAALRDAADAQAIGDEVRKLLETPGSSCDDFTGYHLKQINASWEETLGLYFTGILYFHMG